MNDRLPDVKGTFFLSNLLEELKSRSQIYSRPKSSSLSPYLPLPTTLQQTFTSNPNQTMVYLSEVLSSIDRLSFTFTGRDSYAATKTTLETISPGSLWYFTIFASENTWSRAARRAKQRLPTAQDNMKSTNSNAPGQVNLACRISAFDRSEENCSTDLVAQWTKGAERDLFEGFWSHVCRKLKARG